MSGSSPAPASSTWRAFFFLFGLVIATSPLAAQSSKQYRPMPNYAQFGVPDQEQGRRLMEDFRKLGIAGDYYLEFTLRMMPHRGDETVYQGRMWGGRREEGAYTRLVLTDPARVETRLLILNGPRPAAWRMKVGDVRPVLLDVRQLFEPIGQTVLTPFDLQMAYLYWKDFAFEGIAKVRGRPSYRFLMYPPAEVAAAEPALCGVRISIDSQYRAMVESELIGPRDRTLKVFSLQELKKVRDQWIVEMVEVRDEASRSKTRLTIRAAGLNLSFADGLFEPDALGRDFAPPTASAVEHFGE